MGQYAIVTITVKSARCTVCSTVLIILISLSSVPQMRLWTTKNRLWLVVTSELYLGFMLE